MRCSYDCFWSNNFSWTSDFQLNKSLSSRYLVLATFRMTTENSRTRKNWSKKTVSFPFRSGKGRAEKKRHNSCIDIIIQIVSSTPLSFLWNSTNFLSKLIYSRLFLLYILMYYIVEVNHTADHQTVTIVYFVYMLYGIDTRKC